VEGELSIPYARKSTTATADSGSPLQGDSAAQRAISAMPPSSSPSSGTGSSGETRSVSTRQAASSPGSTPESDGTTASATSLLRERRRCQIKASIGASWLAGTTCINCPTHIMLADTHDTPAMEP
jgi:hypothetical protein